jgi:hypothetical protein
MELRTEKPEITAKNYLSVGPGEYPCGNNLYLIVTPSGGRRWAFRYQRNGIVKTAPQLLTSSRFAPSHYVDKLQCRLNRLLFIPAIISMKDNLVSETVVAEPPPAAAGMLANGG